MPVYVTLEPPTEWVPLVNSTTPPPDHWPELEALPPVRLRVVPAAALAGAIVFERDRDLGASGAAGLGGGQGAAGEHVQKVRAGVVEELLIVLEVEVSPDADLDIRAAWK